LSIEDHSDLPKDGGSFPIAESELKPLHEYLFNFVLNELKTILDKKYLAMVNSTSIDASIFK
jgi:ATP-dependent protease HslVU (ClpYQ) ATPase subunit